MNTITRGALAGAVGGGMVMVMWSMFVLWLDGSGFWKPLNLIAHTFWRDAPISSQFSVGAAVLGVIVHMMMSMMRGGAFALAVQRVHARAAGMTGIGMILGLVLWVVMQYVVWRIVDADAAAGFTPWVFAIGHAMYGAATGFVVAALGTAGARRTTTGHAAAA